MAKQIQQTKEIDNGENKEIVIPFVMQKGENMQQIAQDLKNDINKSRAPVDLSRYYVMEGMQNEEKNPFFTHYLDFNDTLRMNTIEMYVKIAPLIVRKTSAKNREKINVLMNEVYIEHTKTHKRNMTSYQRLRETAYVKILSSENSNTEIVPTGIKKFFGIGGNKQK